MKITQQEAREFLDKINENDSVGIITHNDMDGFCSGRLFFEFCNNKKCKDVQVFITSANEDVLKFDLEKFNKILISDLGPSFVSKRLAELNGKEILYTDHHQKDSNFSIPEYVFELRTISEGYIPSSRTVYEITESVNSDLKWVSVLGVIADMGNIHGVNRNFLESFYEDTNKNFEFYSQKTIEMNSVIIYFSPDFSKAFSLFCNVLDLNSMSEIEKYSIDVSNEFARLKEDFGKNKEIFDKIVYYNLESKFPAIKSALITSISSESPDKVYIFVSERKNKLSISARNQSNSYDVSLILKKTTEGFKDSFAGGHKVAAGASINLEDLEKFKDNLKILSIGEYKI